MESRCSLSLISVQIRVQHLARSCDLLRALGFRMYHLLSIQCSKVVMHADANVEWHGHRRCVIGDVQGYAWATCVTCNVLYWDLVLPKVCDIMWHGTWNWYVRLCTLRDAGGTFGHVEVCTCSGIHAVHAHSCDVVHAGTEIGLTSDIFGVCLADKC